MERSLRATLCVAVSIVILTATFGCQRRHFFVENPGGIPGPIGANQALKAPRNLAMFSGYTGDQVTWGDIRRGMQWADVILVGEQHNDATGHRVELALVNDAINLVPAAAVSMEMLERDEQDTLDAYLAGKISQEQFVDKTGSKNWGAPGKWGQWYQPIVDAARDARVPVIAANSPRRYVRQARIEGYGALWALPGNQRAWFFLPERVLTGPYARRFKKVMSYHAAPRKSRASKKRPTSQPASRPARPKRRPKFDVDAFFRAQLLWDSTMAGSIVHALDSGSARVIHLVGQFHTDFDGGTVQYLLDRRGDLKILTISMQNTAARSLRSEDRRRADVVIYTGAEMKKGTGSVALSVAKGGGACPLFHRTGGKRVQVRPRLSRPASPFGLRRDGALKAPAVPVPFSLHGYDSRTF